jgi:hypothetical protein
MIVRRLLVCSLLGLLVGVAGCSPIKPWVKPYERQNIADELMSFERDPVASSYLHHVYDARESARGCDGASGGGCGCN